MIKASKKRFGFFLENGSLLGIHVCTQRFQIRCCRDIVVSHPRLLFKQFSHRLNYKCFLEKVTIFWLHGMSIHCLMNLRNHKRFLKKAEN